MFLLRILHHTDVYLNQIMPKFNKQIWRITKKTFGGVSIGPIFFVILPLSV